MGGQTISHGNHTNLYTKNIDHGGHLVIVHSLQCTNIRVIALTGPLHLLVIAANFAQAKIWAKTASFF